MGRPKAKLELTVEERAALCRFARRLRTGAGLVMRAKIVLKCATGIDNQDVAEELGVSQDMVGKWRKRFVEKRLDGLLDEPPPIRTGVAIRRGIEGESREGQVELTQRAVGPITVLGLYKNIEVA